LGVIHDNINIEYRFGDGLAERFPVLVADLVALKTAVIVVGSTAGILAARKVTRITPLIWFGIVDDPVGLVLVESFARPGGNLTGIKTRPAPPRAPRRGFLCSESPCV